MRKLTGTLCLSIIILSFHTKSINAEHNFNLLTLNVDEIKKTANDLSKVRFAFLDLNQVDKKIALRVIDYYGNTKINFSLPEKIIDRSSKNYRWGATLQYDKNDNTFLIGLWGSGIFRFSEDGTLIKKYSYPNVSHSIELLKNGNILFPFAWSDKNENQITEIDASGLEVWRWNAKKFIDDENPSETISKREPESFVAITGATYLDNETVVATLSQSNRILFINRLSGNVKSQIISTRPHAPVIHNKKLIGYTSRAPNSLNLWNDQCDCFRKIELLDKNAVHPRRDEWGWARSLSLQFIGKDQWFASGITSLRQLTTDGNKIWHLQISPKRQWKGFHKVVRYTID
jgi:hypothetical protein